MKGGAGKYSSSRLPVVLIPVSLWQLKESVFDLLPDGNWRQIGSGKGQFCILVRVSSDGSPAVVPF
jgi:hypothetical protein